LKLGEIDKLYTNNIELYRRAMRDAEECINDIIKDFAAEGLFRVLHPVEARLKSLNSLKKNVYKESVPLDQILKKIRDIAGIRVVVNNLSDVYRLVEKVKASSKLKYDKLSYEDKIANPPKSGYRAVHFIVYVKVEYKGETYNIPCEIQVRTLLQDSWAVLSHTDIYKGPDDIPPVIQKLSLRLADMLAVLDQVAQDIRDELSKEMEPSGTIEDEEPLTKQAIGIVFYEIFGEKPQEYELQSAFNELKDVGLSKVGDLKNHLPDERIKVNLDTLHQRFFNGWPISDMDSLVWGVKVKLIGDSAYAEFVERVKGEWQEVVHQSRGETLYDLPKTIDELIKYLQDELDLDVGFFDALKELDGLGECDLCGENILEPYRAYEALCDHYNMERSELLDLLNNICWQGTIVECEDTDHSGLCPHCAHLLYSDNT
jgi:ppGpp synthetase/RelA/SpoT-type nucleotidyltranferase